MKSYWHGQVVPLPDELLTSWISRLSRRVGLTVYLLIRRIVGTYFLYCRDTDLYIGRTQLDKLATFAGIDVAILEAHTLRPEFGQPVGGVTPGVLAYGIYHRARRRHGLQYCPLCLSEASLFRKEWRFALQFGCATHAVRLMDGCPHCDAPLMPHRRFDGNPRRCSACSGPLIVEPIRLTSGESEACRSTHGLYGAGGMAIGADFISLDQVVAGIRVLFGFVAGDRVSKDLIECFGADLDRRPVRHLFEMLETSRVELRAWSIPLCLEMLKEWPVGFVDACLESEVIRTRIVEDRRALIPAWLGLALDRLPRSGRKKREPRAKVRRRRPRALNEMGYTKALQNLDLRAYLASAVQACDAPRLR